MCDVGRECGRDGDGRDRRLRCLSRSGRQKALREAAGVEAQLELAPGAHQAIVLDDAQPTAIGHDPLRHAGGLGSTARSQAGELRIDVAKRKPRVQQPDQLPSHHELGELEPLDRSSPPRRLEQPAPQPVSHRGTRHAEHVGHHRHRVETAYARMFVREERDRPGCGRPPTTARLGMPATLRWGTVVRDLGGHGGFLLGCQNLAYVAEASNQIE